jgi:hypothetical protein
MQQLVIIQYALMRHAVAASRSKAFDLGYGAEQVDRSLLMITVCVAYWCVGLCVGARA